jgi:acetylglutamate kinase
LKLLVKLGGTLLDDVGTRKSLARQFAEVSGEDELVIVHGGGKQMTRYLDERGIASRFVDGLRVSDEAVIDAASKVIAGSVNKQFVAALRAAGQLAVGLSGVDGRLTDATCKDPALGLVGRPERSNGTLLELLIAHRYLPVVACIAGDENGTIYNVNADQMAVSCAIGFGAEKLIFLTDVPGVRDAAGRVLPQLVSSDISSLIESGVAHGGMRAKLEAAAHALETGVKEVVIAPGIQPEVLAALSTGRRIGTRLLPPAVAMAPQWTTT